MKGFLDAWPYGTVQGRSHKDRLERQKNVFPPPQKNNITYGVTSVKTREGLKTFFLDLKDLKILILYEAKFQILKF